MKQWKYVPISERKLTLNRVMVDWITMTTYNKELQNQWWSSPVLGRSRVDGSIEEGRFQQYHGLQRKYRTGSVFVGDGLQRGKWHGAAWISSALADEAWRGFYEYSNMPDRFRAKVTRLDIQMTIEQPDWWYQRDFQIEQEDDGRIVEKRASEDDENRETSSLYVGSQKSDKYLCVYQKIADDGTWLLRAELRYSNKHKPGKADWNSGVIFDDSSQLQAIYSDDLLKYGSKMIDKAFGGLLSQNGRLLARQIRYSRETKTRKWLMSTVLTSLGRHLAKEPDNELVERFMEVLIRGTENGE